MKTLTRLPHPRKMPSRKLSLIYCLKCSALSCIISCCSQLVSQLSSVERYALRHVEETEKDYKSEQLLAADAELAAQKKGLEEAQKAEEEEEELRRKRLKEEEDDDDDDSSVMMMRMKKKVLRTTKVPVTPKRTSWTVTTILKVRAVMMPAPPTAVASASAVGNPCSVPERGRGVTSRSICGCWTKIDV